ncbi:MFS transporter [Actinoallomurus liliacearum]|uniref:MFS transporter n=1 Tax=Actinoallomurus liliacearum TaxID=1080073 RepID=A0ABP8TCI4_9ACTN
MDAPAVSVSALRPRLQEPRAGLGPRLGDDRRAGGMSGRGQVQRRTASGRAADHLARITGPLRSDRRFRRYFIASQVDAAGTTMEVGALAFVVLGTGAGAPGIAMVLLANMVAGIVTSPLGGVVADRLPRALLIAVVEVVIGLITVAETILIATGRAAVWNLAVLAAANSAAASFSDPARVGLIAAIAQAERLQEANALVQLSRHLIRAIGPAVGGTIVATAGPAYGVGLNAVSFFGSAALIATIRVPRVVRQPFSLRADLVEGWAAVRSRPWIWAGLLGAAVMVPGWHVGYGILGPPWVKAHLGGAWAWGLIASSLGCGMALGALVALLWRPRCAGWTNCLGCAALALPDPFMAAGAPLPVVMASVAVGAGGLSIASIAWQTAIQQHVPAGQQGRVAAYAGIAEISLAPVGYLLVAPVTGAIGVRATLAGCGVLLAAANLAPLLSRDVRRLRLHPPGSSGPEQAGSPRRRDAGGTVESAETPAGASQGRPGDAPVR